MTKTDILRVAKQYLRPDDLTYLVVGKPEEFGKPLSTLNLPVKEIDLTIPDPKQTKSAATADSVAKGKKLLQLLQKNIGGADKLAAVKDYSHQAEVELQAGPARCALNFRYFVQDFLLPVFQEAWPGTMPLVPALDRLEVNPRWSRVFADVGHLLSCGFVMRGAGGEQLCQWLVPQKGLLGLLGEVTQQHGESAAVPTEGSPSIETLVRELPVEIAVQLGSAELSLSQLARLDVGDTFDNVLADFFLGLCHGVPFGYGVSRIGHRLNAGTTA